MSKSETLAVDAEAALAMARAAGQNWVDAVAAARIAAGASAAIRAVQGVDVQGVAVQAPPGSASADFLTALEVLAEPAG